MCPGSGRGGGGSGGVVGSINGPHEHEAWGCVYLFLVKFSGCIYVYLFIRRFIFHLPFCLVFPKFVWRYSGSASWVISSSLGFYSFTSILNLKSLPLNPGPYPPPCPFHRRMSAVPPNDILVALGAPRRHLPRRSRDPGVNGRHAAHARYPGMRRQHFLPQLQNHAASTHSLASRSSRSVWTHAHVRMAAGGGADSTLVWK